MSGRVRPENSSDNKKFVSGVIDLRSSPTCCLALQLTRSKFSPLALSSDPAIDPKIVIFLSF